MQINTLKLFHFRNFQEISVQFSPGVNCIYGLNGQGKTNLIEAINFLSLTKSFRTNSFRELITLGEHSGSVFAKIEGKYGESEIGIALEGNTRKAFVNGKPVSSIADYLGHLLCVSFSPSDLILIKGAPAERRRFMDRHIVDIHPSSLSHLLQYSRALKNKNALLRSGSARAETLAPWNTILCESSLHILDARVHFLKELEILAQEIHQQYARDDGDLELRLKSNIFVEGKIPKKDALLSLYEESAQKEILYGTSLIGPHRDDVLISLGEKKSRLYASQGQTRSLVLSLKLGVIALMEKKCGEAPIVLLDDVDSELDRKRSQYFFDTIFQNGRQVFLTGTEERDIKKFGQGKHSLFCIKDAKVELQNAENLQSQALYESP